MYRNVQNLKVNGVPPAEIVRQTGLDWKTVKKYLAMTENDYLLQIQRTYDRPRSFEPCREDILSCYARAQNRKLHVSSVFDYLEERRGPLPGSERTLRNFIRHLTITGALILGRPGRQYQRVPELPFGQQMQVDFGQATMPSGLKLFLFAAVLSRSRFKIVYCQDRPFSTRDVIRSLLDGFREIGGTPRELAIDQDRLMVVSENAGDIILTKEFQSFVDEQGLKLFVCRKADPESKGKVENLVGFIKKNFLDARDFSRLDEARVSLRKWLSRRANGRSSAATGRVPAVALEEERSHLHPLRASIFSDEEHAERITREIDGFRQVTVQGRRYQVPSDYRQKTVLVAETSDQAKFFDPQTHLEVGSSATVTTSVPPKDGSRAPSRTLVDLRQKADDCYSFPEWPEFLRCNQERFQRHGRDQLGVFFRSVHGTFPETLVQKAVLFCLDCPTESMTDLLDTCKHLARPPAAEKNPVALLATGIGSFPRPALLVAKRSTKEYSLAALDSKGVAA